MNPNWQRWIHASLLTYVKTELESRSVFVHFENQSREQLSQKTDYVEFRWNGPDAREVSRGYWYLDLVLNFVITSTTNRSDVYTHRKVVGVVQSILTKSIPVYKYGNGPEDDQTLFGCLLITVQGTADGVMTNYFGRMQEVELEESTVEARYCLSGNLT